MLKSSLTVGPIWACHDQGDVLYFETMEEVNNEFPTQYNVRVNVANGGVWVANSDSSITSGFETMANVDAIVIAFTTMLETLEDLETGFTKEERDLLAKECPEFWFIESSYLEHAAGDRLYKQAGGEYHLSDPDGNYTQHDFPNLAAALKYLNEEAPV